MCSWMADVLVNAAAQHRTPIFRALAQRMTHGLNFKLVLSKFAALWLDAIRHIALRYYLSDIFNVIEQSPRYLNDEEIARIKLSAAACLWLYYV